LTTELQALIQQRNQLRATVAQLQEQNDAENAQIEAQVAPLKTAADGLAAAFRASYNAAAAAHAAEDGAAASALAQQGKAQQAQCKALNSQANQLRTQFNPLLSGLKDARGELKSINQRIQALTQKPRRLKTTRASQPGPLGKIQMKGFHRAPEGIDAAFVQQVLREVPGPVLGQIDSVAFIDQVDASFALGRTAAKPKVSEKARVHLFRHPFDFDDQDLRRDYRETILHESGHVLFERLLTGSQRFAWGGLFNDTLRQGGLYISDRASDSIREDFAECFLFWIANVGRLSRKQPARYAMINEIIRGIEK